MRKPPRANNLTNAGWGIKQMRRDFVLGAAVIAGLVGNAPAANASISVGIYGLDSIVQGTACDPVGNTCFPAQYGAGGPGVMNAKIVDKPTGMAAAASVRLAGSVLLKASANGGTSIFPILQTATAQAQLAYFIEIVGPQNVVVPLGLNAVLTTSGSTTGDLFSTQAAEADLFFLAGIGFTTQYLTCHEITEGGGDGCFGTPSHLAIHDVLQAPTNVAIEISEIAAAAGKDGGIGHATADPYFYLEPGTLADGYSLVVSDGVANAPPSAAAEPQTWTIMLLGLLGLAGVTRRKGWVRLSP
jgi:hypothetical protein